MGRAEGPARDLDEPRRIARFDSDEGAALLVLEGSRLAWATRVVASDGKIGPAVPFQPPVKTSHEHARFGVLDGPNGAAVQLLRFDAEGRALDAEPVTIAEPLSRIAGSAMARVGDTFVVTYRTAMPGSIAKVVRVRDTGEIVDVSDVEPNTSVLAAPRGVACSPSECAIVWSGTTTIGGNTPREVLDRAVLGERAFPPHHPPEFLALGASAGIVFDGRSFLAAFTQENDLGVARIDADGRRIGRGMLDGDAFQGGSLQRMAPRSCLASSNVGPRPARAGGDPVSTSATCSTRKRAPSGGRSGGAGSSSTGEVVGGGGCSCQLDARSDPAWWIAIAALVAVRLRRRSR